MKPSASASASMARVDPDAAVTDRATTSQADPVREHLIETYRKKARHYDIVSRLSPVPGYPVRAQRRRALDALGLRPGATVVEIGCGTGLNFPLIEAKIAPGGWIIGVDLTDAMLDRARARIATNGWANISLVQADAADFDFPAEVDAILSTYSLTQVSRCAEVIARGAKALSDGGRWVVLDLKLPAHPPRWLLRLGTAVLRPHASIDQWIACRPWDAIHTAMYDELTVTSWTELCFGTAFLAAGFPRQPRAREGSDPRPRAATHRQPLLRPILMPPLASPPEPPVPLPRRHRRAASAADEGDGSAAGPLPRSPVLLGESICSSPCRTRTPPSRSSAIRPDRAATTAQRHESAAVGASRHYAS